MILKLGMQHGGLKLHKVCINDDPRLTLTFFARSNLVTYAFELGNLLQSFNGKNLLQMTKLTEDLCF